ncbi:MAG TPA: zinc-binding dehydrogenase [Cytophagales bacterium]|nr:zinc-binding dehydrogenase [Cytophagales bacterium]
MNAVDVPVERAEKEMLLSREKDTMQAAVLVAPRRFELQEVPVPTPNADEVVFKVEGCGVCASSIPVFEGREWFTYPAQAGSPGHEAWGYVTAVGSQVRHLKVGDRIVALSYNGYSEFDKALALQAVKIPNTEDHMPGEALGCAMNIFHRSDIQRGQTVAVIGAGFLGALLIQLAKGAGASVIALSARQHSLEVAKDFGADHTVLMDDHYGIIEHVKTLTDGQFCDRVIEATGKEWPLNLAAELCMERGKLIIAGYHQDGMRSVNIQLWNWRGLDVINAHERDPKVYVQGMQAAVAAVSERIITPDKLYTLYTLDQIQQAFEDLIHRPTGFTKAVIVNKNGNTHKN